MNFALNLSALPERLREKIYVEPNTGCWLWMGKINPDGYGLASFNGGPFQAAHRLIWKLLVGPIIYRLHHGCHTPLCVNPIHQEDLCDAEHGIAHRKQFCKHGHDLTKPGSRYKTGDCKICHNAAQIRSDNKPERRERVKRYQAEWRRTQKMVGKALP